MGYPHPIHPKETPVLSKHFGEAAARTYAELGAARRLCRGSGTADRRMAPDDVINEVKASGLRGRGGAGFPTGTPAWSFMPAKAFDQACTTISAATPMNPEPGTFRRSGDPALDAAHALIEGCAIAQLDDPGRRTTYIYIRGASSPSSYQAFS